MPKRPRPGKRKIRRKFRRSSRAQRALKNAWRMRDKGLDTGMNPGQNEIRSFEVHRPPMPTTIFRRPRQAPEGRKLLWAAPMLGLAPSAQADIIYTNINGGGGVTIAFNQYLNFNVAAGTFQIGSTQPGDDFELGFSYSQISPFINGGREGSGVAYESFDEADCASRLAADVFVDGSLAWADSGFLEYQGDGPWAPGQSGYVGLVFNDGSSTVYGWAALTLTAASEITLWGFAYETSGGGINTGAVPEPATNALLGALVAGSAAAFAARHKRKLAQAV